MLKKRFVVLSLLMAFAVFAGTLIGCQAAKDAREKGTEAAKTVKETVKEKVGGETKAETIKIGAIFSVTGKASFLGEPEKKTVEMLEEQINANGGINGTPIDVIVYDDEGDETKTQELAKKLLFEDQVVAIIGPSRSGNTMAIKKLMNDNQTVLVSAAAAEAIVAAPDNEWIFKTPQKDSFVAQHILQHMQDNGITNIAVLYGNTGFGQEGLGQIKAFAPDYGVEVGFESPFEPSATEGDLETLLTKVKSNGKLQAVVNWSILPAQSIVPKKMKQLGISIPLYHSHGFGNIKFVEAAGDAANGVIFPGGRLLVANGLADDDPQKVVLVGYKEGYESRYAEEVSTFGGHAYDALWIVVNAIEEAGADKAAIRDAVENATFVGTGGMFNFSPEDHNGLGMDSLSMLTVKNGSFALLEQ
jgi:branched-chain amino acid transport system substrate-binding protein